MAHDEATRSIQASYSHTFPWCYGCGRNNATGQHFAGIRVNAVAPGAIAVESSTRVLKMMDDPGAKATASDREPIVAAAVLFLVSHEASYVTGHVMLVDGGRSAGQ